MAQLSLGESRWRMVRLALKRKKFRYQDCRNMARQDEAHFEWLLAQGLFRDLGDGWYEVTADGKAAAELGFYETDARPAPAAAEARARARRP
jgi:hypothetical protein